MLCATAMLFSFTACGGGKSEEDKFSDKTSSSVEQGEKEDTENKTESSEEENKKEYVEFNVLYEINSDGNAEVVGYTGEGNHITISSEYEGKDVVRIADSAFKDCKMLEGVIMWADIEEIGDSAFKGCTGLAEFSVPNSTKIIGHHAFEGCDGLQNLIIWGDPDIGEYAFAYCTNLTEISIGSDTKNVGAHAFEGCTGVSSLIFWGAEIVGDYAFAGCTGIKEVSIPSDTLSIGNHTFDGCSELTSVIVWNDDTAIGKDAFANCPKLSDIPASRGTVLQCTMDKPDTNEPNQNENDGKEENSTTVDEEKAESDTETESSEVEKPDENLIDGMRPEFKEAMDSYEEFYTEYCDFIKKYNENPTDFSLLTQYGEMLKKAGEMDESFKKWDDGKLNDAETKYYLEVTNRISQKLLDIAI